MRYPLLAMTAALVAVASVHAAEPLYVYEGDGLTIRVLGVSDDETTVTGEIIKGNDRWPFTGQSSSAGDVETVKGTFRVGGEAYGFAATHREKDGRLTFVTDGTTYNLRQRGAAGAPAPAAATADKPAAPARTGSMTFTSGQFRDINMGNVVAYTMLIPAGFTAEGHIEWSQDRTPYPQLKIKVHAPDKSQIAFSPAASFTYWEWTEQVRAEQARSGMVLPDRQGTPPPADLAAWVMEVVGKNPAVSNARLVSDDRDKAAEAAMDEQERQAGGSKGATREVHLIRLTYLLEGVPMTEELSLTYGKLPPMNSGNMISSSWMLFTNSAVRAPSARWEELRPVLYASVKSLQPVPKWFTQSQELIMAITKRNHVISMRDIAARAAHYDKMSDENMAAWRKAQTISDKKQDERINMIYEVSNFAGPDGTVTKLPNGFKHYYSDGKGGFQMSNSTEPPKEGNWTPVEPMR